MYWRDWKLNDQLVSCAERTSSKLKNKKKTRQINYWDSVGFARIVWTNELHENTNYTPQIYTHIASIWILRQGPKLIWITLKPTLGRFEIVVGVGDSGRMTSTVGHRYVSRRSRQITITKITMKKKKKK